MSKLPMTTRMYPFCVPWKKFLGINTSPWSWYLWRMSFAMAGSTRRPVSFETVCPAACSRVTRSFGRVAWYSHSQPKMLWCHFLTFWWKKHYVLRLRTLFLISLLLNHPHFLKCHLNTAGGQAGKDSLVLLWLHGHLCCVQGCAWYHHVSSRLLGTSSL